MQFVVILLCTSYLYYYAFGSDITMHLVVIFLNRGSDIAIKLLLIWRLYYHGNSNICLCTS